MSYLCVNLSFKLIRLLGGDIKCIRSDLNTHVFISRRFLRPERISCGTLIVSIRSSPRALPEGGSKGM
jgi:hypothetical protein